MRRLTSAAIALALVFAPAAAAAKKPKPDLAFYQTEFTAGWEAVRGEPNVLRFYANTENRGKGAARRSETAISFLPVHTRPGATEIPGFSLKVSRLPGTDPHGNTAKDPGEAVSPPMSFDGYPIGTYQAMWCADAKNVVKEKNERNNCVKAEPFEETLNLTKPTFRGTVSGSAPINDLRPGNARQSWVSNDARLVLGTSFADHTEPETFVYSFVGNVEWTVQGTDGRGCEWSGGGSGFFDGTKTLDGGFYLYLARGLYGGVQDATNTFTFPATQRCGTTTTTKQIYPASAILNTITPDYTGNHPFDYEGETMIGSASQALGGNEGTAADPYARWTWDLR
jgi:hypothetical protein